MPCFFVYQTTETFSPGTKVTFQVQAKTGTVTVVLGTQSNVLKHVEKEMELDANGKTAESKGEIEIVLTGQSKLYIGVKLGSKTAEGEFSYTLKGCVAERRELVDGNTHSIQSGESNCYSIFESGTKTYAATTAIIYALANRSTVIMFVGSPGGQQTCDDDTKNNCQKVLEPGRAEKIDYEIPQDSKAYIGILSTDPDAGCDFQYTIAEDMGTAGSG